MKTTPGVSVVIPTYRRNDLLLRCLQALEEQTYPSDRIEVIVCDDAAATSTQVMVECLAKLVPYRLRYVPVISTQGPAAARNRGWECAHYEFIGFTDDDTVPEPAWLSEGLKSLEGALAVAGRVVVPLPSAPTDYEKNEAGLQDTEFVTANCFVRRSVLQQLKGFDERFTAAWREDSDLQFRILSLSQTTLLHTIVRCESARVRHPIRPARWGISLLQQKKSVFNALLLSKHPRLFRQRIEPRPPVPYYVACLCCGAVVVGVLSHEVMTSLIAGALWLCVTGAFCLRRLKGTSRQPAHVVEMVITSSLIPPLAIFWRLVGAWRYKVLYL